MVLGICKPAGLSSHDVVARVRRVFGERRVGHAGTLDPFASGVLPILVGPATRLDKYMTVHDKTYVAEVTFGRSTTTDDRTGEVLRSSDVPARVADADFAAQTLDAFVGASMQMPPAYSAIKVGGRKACDEARRGNIITLEPRPIEVYAARLLGIERDGDAVTWRVGFHVSKGTYVRALARDIGKRIGVPAHLAELERTRVGCIGVADCCPLDDIDEVRAGASIDPVRLLGFKCAFVEGAEARSVANGGALALRGRRIFEGCGHGPDAGCSCMPTLHEVRDALAGGEFVSVVAENKLAAIYRFDAHRGCLVADCVFQTEVSRGADIPA